jgi:hypothetical protein
VFDPEPPDRRTLFQLGNVVTTLHLGAPAERRSAWRCRPFAVIDALGALPVPAVNPPFRGRRTLPRRRRDDIAERTARLSCVLPGRLGATPSRRGLAEILRAPAVAP